MPEVQVLILVAVLMLLFSALLAVFHLFTFDPDYHSKGSEDFAKGVIVGASSAFFTSSIFLFLAIKLISGVEV